MSLSAPPMTTSLPAMPLTLPRVEGAPLATFTVFVPSPVRSVVVVVPLVLCTLNVSPPEPRLTFSVSRAA